MLEKTHILFFVIIGHSVDFCGSEPRFMPQEFLRESYSDAGDKNQYKSFFYF